MRLLIYHGKHRDQYWLADTPDRLEAALRILFTELDALGCYTDDEIRSLTLQEAREGDAHSIRHILESHKSYEYENWDLEEAYDPLWTA